MRDIDDVLRNNWGYRDGCHCGTWPLGANDGVHFLLGDACVLPYCMLGLEYQWVGIQARSP
jgi:hypothetical protein